MLVDELRSIVGDEACLVSEEALFAYECDALTLHAGRPLAVVLPESREQVVAVVKACRAAGVAFVPRGAGTGLSGGATAQPEDLTRVLLFKRNLEKICRDRDDLVEQIQVTVRHEIGHHLGLSEEDLERLGLA